MAPLKTWRAQESLLVGHEVCSYDMKFVLQDMKFALQDMRFALQDMGRGTGRILVETAQGTGD